MTVKVNADDGGSGSDTSTAQVGDVVAGVPATLTVASFGSTDSTASASDFTATINWGDGLASGTGTVTGSGGVFQVQGVHTFAVDSYGQAGNVYDVTVTISGPASETLANNTNVKVARPPMVGLGNNVTATVGVGFTNATVATFTEPDTSDGTSEFSATIYWGDGTSVLGQLWNRMAY